MQTSVFFIKKSFINTSWHIQWFYWKILKKTRITNCTSFVLQSFLPRAVALQNLFWVIVLKVSTAWLSSMVHQQPGFMDKTFFPESPWFHEKEFEAFQESVLPKQQTYSGWSLRPPPPPARKATSCHSGIRLHTCASCTRGRDRSSPYSPRPNSHTCHCRWRAVDLCGRTLCSWLPCSACRVERTRLVSVFELLTLRESDRSWI